MVINFRKIKECMTLALKLKVKRMNEALLLIKKDSLLILLILIQINIYVPLIKISATATSSSGCNIDGCPSLF